MTGGDVEEGRGKVNEVANCEMEKTKRDGEREEAKKEGNGSF